VYFEIFTIGHSNRSIEEFLSLLSLYKIEILVDVRRWPMSNKFPHFNSENLSRSLSSIGLKYIWMEDLGGYRKFGKDVEDFGIAKYFKSEGFRAYATYVVKSEKARNALRELLNLAKNKITCIMCSEMIPYFCHRKIISDILSQKGYVVKHIISEKKFLIHKLSEWARAEKYFFDF
jgi:uncharacterized protein (DUF488 family)